MKLTTKKKLITFISEQFSEINKSVKYLNNGGCGIFAEELYNLMKSVKLKPNIVLLTNNEIIANDVLKNNRNISELPFSHIMIKVNGRLLDSNGMYKTHKETKWFAHCSRVSGMPIDKLKELNNDRTVWNPVFDISQAPTIKKKFNKIYKKISENNLVD